MKSQKGSSIFYLLVACAFVVLFLAIPFPYYNQDTKAWFFGDSIGSRILYNHEQEGIPLDQIVGEVTRSTVASPLDISCSTDSDCKQYIVINQCDTYCGNLSSENDKAVDQLNVRRICDPKLWDAPKLDCKCLAGKCVSLN